LENEPTKLKETGSSATWKVKGKGNTIVTKLQLTKKQTSSNTSTLAV
jgi:hypothetical protein